MLSWILSRLAIKKALLLAAFIFTPGSNASSLIEERTASLATNAQCELTLGWGDWAPYQFVEQGDSPTGLQIDLVKQIAEQANCELKFVRQPFSQNIQSVRDGSVDFTMDTTVTAERQKYALFSEPYRQEVLVLYVKPQFVNQCSGKSFSDIVKSGVRIGLTQGNIYGDSVSKVQNTPQLNKKLVYANKNANLIDLLKSDRLDGFFEDPTVLSYSLRKNNLSGALKSCKITVYSGTVSFMFSKKTVSEKLVSRFNQALRKVKKTESYLMNWAW
ncbi:substrate-binding periplasmic protein [Aliikangiella coralliicola]|uniref:Amino acid ABC transporter substrate-binding protein n=1 Tax=Aliikangiella coralliicola TaxID=2592383 RepID=A0A545UDC5_9GAMM|nr:transporter substrate-binding domain-containing protein [Aliikangiella coralliicola]TQV87472.1 amino acid ABC transporter substrate-binding protein [Aliikangiella coralliicola]